MRTTQECYEQYWTNPGSNILEKTAVRPFNSHLKNHPSKTNKTCETQLEKQGGTHVTFFHWLLHMDVSVFDWLTITHLHQFCGETGWSLEDLPGWRESQGNPCCQHDLIISSWSIINIIIKLLATFSHPLTLEVFHWSLSDSQSFQISRTLLSILIDLNTAVVWIVSNLPLISNAFSLIL